MRAKVSFCVGYVLLIAGFLFFSSSSFAQDFQIPKQADWTDHGPILTPGPAGAWDVRLDGMISPCAVVKKDGTYFLYYIGADGNRSSDGGPRHRALGVATSTDGFTFVKYAGNPIITFLPNNNEEEGIFSAGATLDASGNIVLYYGAMDAGNATSTSVDSDIVLATSSDGFNFSGHTDILSHSNSSVWGFGDELFPLGVFYSGTNWHVYYTAKGAGGIRWDLGLATGATPTSLPTTQPVLTGGLDIIAGGNPVWLSPTTIALFLHRDFATRIVEVRTASITAPHQLSAPVETYTFSNHSNNAVFLDPSINTWFMYYYIRNGMGSSNIGLRTAPAVNGDTTPPAPPSNLR